MSDRDILQAMTNLIQYDRDYGKNIPITTIASQVLEDFKADLFGEGDTNPSKEKGVKIKITLDGAEGFSFCFRLTKITFTQLTEKISKYGYCRSNSGRVCWYPPSRIFSIETVPKLF